MNEKFQAKLITEISGDADLIPIFPAGTVKGIDGRGPYHLKDAAAIITASVRQHVDLVIDRDHAADLAAPGTAIKAAGWIKELVEKDGAIMARVEWTPAAAQEIKDKEYRYISPTFTFDKATGTVRRILRATLTNTPNFDMKAVAKAQHDTQNPDDDQPEEENDPMNKHLVALAALLAIGNPKTEDEIATAAAARIKELTEAETALASVRTGMREKLGLDDKADDAVLIATAATLKTSTGKQDVDPSKFVPIAAHTELATALKTLQDERAAEKAEAAVAKAMKEGKIVPIQKEWAIGYAKADPESFKNLMEISPALAVAGELIDTTKTFASGGKLDDVDVALCAQLGISQDDYKKAAQ